MRIPVELARPTRLLGVGLLLLALMIGVIAMVDHHVKQTRINHAELEAWYCTHLGTRCGGSSSLRLEARWNERQLVYEWGIGLLAAAGLLLVIHPARLRRRSN